MSADRIATLLDLYLEGESPTGEDLAECGVTPDEVDQVMALVQLDASVQRSATVAALRACGDEVERFLERFPNWGLD